MTDAGPARGLRKSVVADTIREQRLIAVLRRVHPRERMIGLVDELAEAGVRIFEITFDSWTAADDIAEARAFLARRLGGQYLVGAGTILDAGHLEAARRAGADFAVSPVLITELIDLSVSQGFPFIGAGSTPTEMLAAWLAGSTFVKLFPASVAGPAMVREMRGPLPDIELIPTGGVDASNARAFLDAGAVAVGIGSALTKMDAAARQMLVQGVARK